jgi:hypothetical protein
MRFKTFLSIGVILLGSSIFALALDLRFTTAISQAPDPATGGASVTFTVSFKPFDSPVDNLKITGGVDGVGIFERTYAHINAGAQRTDTFTWTATGGAHTAWFELDPLHTAGDSDYSNNRVEKALTVGGGPATQPDLALVVTYTPTNFAAAAAVTFSIKVNNNGTAASNACQMTVKKGGTTVQTINVAAIPAGNHLDKSYSWTAECDAVIEIKVDSNNANVESNEGNNTWSKTMACGDTGGGGIINPKWWLKYKLYAWKPIPLPEPCLSCPPWHFDPNPGDPLELLNGIGDKLGQGKGFADVKGDWLNFLNNNHGLDPNAALKLIFNRAVAGAKSRLLTEKSIGEFQNGLNNALGEMNGLAKTRLNKMIHR